MLTSKSITQGRYNMTAEFFRQTAVRRASGQIIREWDNDNPVIVRNLTEGILGGGIRVVGSTEQWGEDYEEVEWAKMYISDQNFMYKWGTHTKHPELSNTREEITINRRWRVGNIRDRRTGQKLWLADDGDEVMFNILGIQPIRDSFGARGAVEYELLLKGVTGD